jgi:hypothetical protein
MELGCFGYPYYFILSVRQKEAITNFTGTRTCTVCQNVVVDVYGYEYFRICPYNQATGTGSKRFFLAPHRHLGLAGNPAPTLQAVVLVQYCISESRWNLRRSRRHMHLRTCTGCTHVFLIEQLIQVFQEVPIPVIFLLFGKNFIKSNP